MGTCLAYAVASSAVPVKVPLPRSTIPARAAASSAAATASRAASRRPPRRPPAPPPTTASTRGPRGCVRSTWTSGASAGTFDGRGSARLGSARLAEEGGHLALQAAARRLAAQRGGRAGADCGVGGGDELHAGATAEDPGLPRGAGGHLAATWRWARSG